MAGAKQERSFRHGSLSLAGTAALLFGLGIIGAHNAAGHSDEHLAKLHGPHGGILRMADQYHLELLVKEGEAVVWVTDHADQPQSTEGATGRATVLLQDERVQVELSPSGENALSGKAAALHPEDRLRAIVTVTMPGQRPVQARFAPLEAADAGHGQHAH